MADFNGDKMNGRSELNADNVIEELESLSKKYGLAFDASKLEQKSRNTVSSQYAPKKPNDADFIPVQPKNNRPARTPRIVYDTAIGSSSVRIVYGDEQEATGPEGRRVIYKEEESEPIALKRRRNAQAQKSAKGEQGFGSQPYVRHVASSPAAIKKDDSEAFTRAYEKNVQPTEPVKASENGIYVSSGRGRLVAKNPEQTEQKKENTELKHYKATPKDKVKSFFKAFLPWKGDPAKEVIRKIVMDTSAILVLVCFGYFIQNYIDHKKNGEITEEIQSMANETVDDTAAKWAKIKAQFPNVNFPEGMNIKLAPLYGINQDVIGYLKVKNTSIDTVVLQTKADLDSDDEDYYLHHNLYKQYDKYGNAYLDAHCAGTTLSKNNTIYGHNMRDGTSFAELEKYYKIDGFKESPIIYYSTLFEDYTFKVYAAFISNGYKDGDNGYLFSYPNAEFVSEENFNAFIKTIDERKLYDTGVDINSSDKLIILSTCSYEIKKTDMGRLAVVGRLVREGESENVDTSKAKENTNIRYPQIWYDEHNIANPYKNAYKWIP